MKYDENNDYVVRYDNYIGRKIALGIIWTVVTIVVIVCLLVITKACYYGFYQTDNKDGQWSLVYRSATNMDIAVEANNAEELSYTYTITPTKNVDNLSLRFDFTNSNSELIKSQTRKVGNVIKDKSYTVSFSLSEFSLGEVEKIMNCSVLVVGGTAMFF